MWEFLCGLFNFKPLSCSRLNLILQKIPEAAILMLKDDLSFIIADTMNLYEQQSTHNPNMPLRGFLYFASLYENHVFRTGHQQSGE